MLSLAVSPPKSAFRLQQISMVNAEGISNAFQKDLTGDLRQRVSGKWRLCGLPRRSTPSPPCSLQVVAQLSANPTLSEAISATFGTDRFRVQTAKVLMTEFGAEPQVGRSQHHHAIHPSRGAGLLRRGGEG